MQNTVTRRELLATAGTATVAATTTSALAADAEDGKALKILGVSCSPRKGMTTATSVEAALNAARSVDESITTELIDLGGMSIAPWSPNPPEDDMAGLLAKFQDPVVGGLIIGSPRLFCTGSA